MVKNCSGCVCMYHRALGLLVRCRHISTFVWQKGQCSKPATMSFHTYVRTEAEQVPATAGCVVVVVRCSRGGVSVVERYVDPRRKILSPSRPYIYVVGGYDVV